MSCKSFAVSRCKSALVTSSSDKVCFKLRVLNVLPQCQHGHGGGAFPLGQCCFEYTLMFHWKWIVLLEMYLASETSCSPHKFHFSLMATFLNRNNISCIC